jgi:hypothetical protein
MIALIRNTMVFAMAIVIALSQSSCSRNTPGESLDDTAFSYDFGQGNQIVFSSGASVDNGKLNLVLKSKINAVFSINVKCEKWDFVEVSLVAVRGRSESSLGSASGGNVHCTDGVLVFDSTIVTPIQNSKGQMKILIKGFVDGAMKDIAVVDDVLFVKKSI